MVIQPQLLISHPGQNLIANSSKSSNLLVLEI
jgi:hypothetical protein